MPKNIIIFSDGTGQKGGKGNNTNVYKLFNIIEDRTQNQIAYYDPGVGTDWRKITGSLSGRGLSKNIIECYTFLFENFEAGDQIYLYGFSRGAATVRSLSAFIHYFGILPKSRPDLIKKAFKIYKKSSRKNIHNNANAFVKKHHTMWTKIKFIGVWDTVAALGFPIKWIAILLDNFFTHKFHNLDLSESIEFARHALSIDDQRKTFHPQIWTPTKEQLEKEIVKQVWFAGVHTDVGGGYDNPELSNITLKWLLKESISKGLIVYEKSEAYQAVLKSNIDPNGYMESEQKGSLGWIYRTKVRTWTNPEKICIHESVLKRTKNSENKDTPAYSPWVLSYEHNIER
jgi:uncharacterized protein (DUF2235 family)